MKNSLRIALVFFVVGVIFFFTKLDPIELLGKEISYPKIFDILFLAVGGYFLSFWCEQDYDEAAPEGMIGFVSLAIIVIILFIINLFIFSLVSTAAYTFLICFISLLLGAALSICGCRSDSVLDSNNLSYLLVLGVMVGLGFGMFLGLIPIIFFLTIPIITLGINRLLYSIKH